MISPNYLVCLRGCSPGLLTVPLQERCHNMGSVTSCLEWGCLSKQRAHAAQELALRMQLVMKGENLSRHSGDIHDLDPISIVLLRDDAIWSGAM